MNWQDLKRQAEDERRWIEMPVELFQRIAAVVDAARSERAQLLNCNEYNCYPDSQCQKCKNVQDDLDTALESLRNEP